MQVFRRNRLAVRIALITVLMLAAGLQYVRSHRVRPTGRISSASLSEEMPHSGPKVPGNPARALRDGVRFFGILQAYRDSHGGRWPQSKELADELVRNPRRYGFPDVISAHRAFANPDFRYSDDAFVRSLPEGAFPWLVHSTRPDGSPIGSPARVGTRDVLATCSLYAHMNVRHLPGSDSTTIDPVGFYIVVWEDGLVEKVPLTETLMAAGPGGRQVAFKGQAGVPTSADTFAKYYANVPRPPHGAGH